MGPGGGQQQMPPFPNQQFQQQQYPHQQQLQQFQHPSPYFNQQQQGPAYGAQRFQPSPYQQQQQQHQQQYGGPSGQSGPDFVKKLDDFCQNWMGPGHLPNYEIRQNEQCE